MKILIRSKKRWLWTIVLLLAVLVVPYGFSRIASSWRRVRVVSTSGTPAARPTNPDPAVRIVSYNIAHGRGLAPSNWQAGDRAARMARLDEIARLLRKLNADLVVLNEVDFDSSWSYSVNQARYLAEQAGYPHWAEQRNVDFRVLFWKWRFGNAILSKYPITEARAVELPGFSRWETVLGGKKRAMACDIDLRGERLQLIAAHLSHRSQAIGARSAEMLLDIASSSPLPTIIAGDLNSTPPGFPKSYTDASGNNTIKTLDDSGLFKRLPTDGPLSQDDLTFHAAEPNCVIDWILIPRDWHFAEYEVTLSSLSDHRPVVVVVTPESPVANFPLPGSTMPGSKLARPATD